jgi:hypothetical protein
MHGAKLKIYVRILFILLDLSTFTALSLYLQITSFLFVISSLRRGVNEIFALLGCNAVLVGS